MNDLEMTKELSRLMGIAAGEPPRHVTVEQVRRGVVRRRLMTTAVATAAAVIGGVAIGVSASAAAPGHARPAVSRAGAPRYYFQQSYRPGLTKGLIRSTRTGVVRATVGCPDAEPMTDVAAAGDRTFFLVCLQETGPVTRPSLQASRIVRLQLTSAGRLRSEGPVRGGVFAGRFITGLAAAAGGGELAVTVASGWNKPVAREIVVLNTQTGARGTWKGRPDGAGPVSLGDPSLVRGGRELVFVTTPYCPGVVTGPGHCGPKGDEVWAVTPAARGGSLRASRLLLTQGAAGPLTDQLDGVVPSPDGSTLTLAITSAIESAPGGPQPVDSVSVIQASAATGRPLRVLFRVRARYGFFCQVFGADPSGRYLIIDAGGGTGHRFNGWIYRGHLIPLRPADGAHVLQEDW